MDISGFSDQHDVRRLTKDNLEEIYGLCRGNPLYYSYCPPFVTRESIKEDFSALPSGKELRDKYFLGWYEGEKLIAVMDLFYGYPDQETALIGFFMTDVSVQNAGVGTRIIDSLCQALGALAFCGSAWAGSPATRRQSIFGIKLIFPKQGPSFIRTYIW